MEIIAASDFDSGWTVKDLPPQPYPTASGPSAVNMTVTDGVDTQKNPKRGLRTSGGGGWMASGGNPE
jgi:hypothetical protein